MTTSCIQNTEANDAPANIDQPAENRKARLARIAAGAPHKNDVAVEARYQAHLAHKAAIKATQDRQLEEARAETIRLQAAWDGKTVTEKLDAEPIAGREMKGKRDKAAIILATATAMVEFEPAGETVTLTIHNGVDHYLNKVVMALDHARAEYRRLVNAGYYAW